MKRYFVFAAYVLFSLMFAVSSEAREWGERPQTKILNPLGYTAPVPTHQIITDPEGDNELYPQYDKVDVLSVEAGTDGIYITIRVIFSNDTIMDSVVGFIDFDTDMDPKTGIRPNANFWLPTAKQDIGTDFYVYLFDRPNTGMVSSLRNILDTHLMIILEYLSRPFDLISRQ